MSKEEYEKIKKLAVKYSGGNVSEFLRVTALNVKNK
jgi:hypothetical protein